MVTFGELVQRSWYSDSLQAGQSRVKILAGTRNFLISKTVQTSFGLTQAPIQWVTRFFPGDKVLGHDVDLSPPSRAKVKNEWSYNSTLTMYLYSMDTVYVNSGVSLCQVFLNHGDM